VTTVLRCGQLFDGTGSDPVGGAELVIDGETISAAPAPAGAEVIDLSQYFVMPGLIDAHTHLSIDLRRTDQLGQLREPTGRQALRVPRHLGLSLDSGVTTMRIMAEEDWLDVYVREAIEADLLEGPRLLIATRGITGSNGHGRAKSAFDGVEEIRRAVRENLAHGADFIKVFATGGFASGTYRQGSGYSDEELRVAVEEAERKDKYVAVHALGGPGLVAAVKAGAWSIDHCSLVEEPEIEAMLGADCMAVATYSILFHRAGLEGGDATTPALLEQLAAFREAAAASIPAFLSSGIPFAFGTDSMHGYMSEEIRIAIRFGVSPKDALVAATRGGARVLRIEDRVGTLEPGKAADVVAFDGNPLTDESALDRVMFVMRDGRRYR
jgi:imidazolonepropionase-like amidohydrolase